MKVFLCFSVEVDPESHLDIGVALVSWSIHVRQILQENDNVLLMMTNYDHSKFLKALKTSQKSISEGGKDYRASDNPHADSI